MKNMMKTIFALVAFSAVSAQAQQAAMPPQPVVPNPSARWGVTGGANLFLTAEALVYRISQDTNPYAYLVDTLGNVTDYHADMDDWIWGFRVAMGYNMSHDAWDVVGTYTRFNFENTTRVNAPSTGELNSYTSVNPLSKASNEWSVDFNQLDVEMGRQFFVSKYLRVRPKFGFRNVFLDNDQELNMIATTGALEEIDNEEHFWGMGVLAGIDTVWGLAQGFSLYGNFGLAGLLGHFTPKQTIETSATSAHLDKSSHMQNTKAVMDLALGLRWDRNFSDDRFHIGFNFGFEQHVFFNMNRNWFGDTSFENFAGTSGRDFTMSGFAFGGDRKSVV